LRSCFNPRAREGRDSWSLDAKVGDYVVSIHAPVKGATRTRNAGCAGTHVSIHAPVKGATLGEKLIYWLDISFNPRAREGRDKGTATQSGQDMVVSIHAPVKGATSKRCYWIIVDC